MSAPSLTTIETAVRMGGGLFALAVFIVLMAGVLRGLRRPSGLAAGRSLAFLRSPAFLLLISILFFGLCIFLWRPLPLRLTPGWRIAALALGALLTYAGLAGILWSRLTLGSLYNVSSVFGAQLFAGHRLVTRGPYALLRHPLYASAGAAALGCLLLYRTWTGVFLLLLSLDLIPRARQEERALSAAFGEQWQAYCRRVPFFFPRLFRPRRPLYES